MLLPGGMFTPLPPRPVELAPDDLLVALSRIVAAHGATAHDSASPEDAAAVVRSFQEGGAMPLPGWPDLPGVACSHTPVHEHLTHYGALAGANAGSLHATRHRVMPIGWSCFSPALAPRELLIAMGRMWHCHLLALQAVNRPTEVRRGSSGRKPSAPRRPLP